VRRAEVFWSRVGEGASTWVAGPDSSYRPKLPSLAWNWVKPPAEARMKAEG